MMAHNEQTRLGGWPWRRRDGARRDDPRVVSRFELWPPALFYLPSVLQWAAEGLRHGSLSLPTAANPAMENGGLWGESKLALHEMLAPEARRWLAPMVGIITGARIGTEDLDAARAAIAEAGLVYPIVAKPDVGCRGAGVRLIEDDGALARYLAVYPRRTPLVLQRFVPHANEASIFYVRHPAAPRGRIFSITLKYFPQIVGDGQASVAELIGRDPRARRFAAIYLKRFAEIRGKVLAPGEILPLVFVGNHCRGAEFRDGRGHVTRELLDRIESIARAIPDFHFGRFDLRFASLAALQRGEGFEIIEVNGAGSEATHIWDKDATLFDAWRTLHEQFRLLFEISAANRARGAEPTGTLPLIRAFLRHRRLMKAYPPN